MKDRFRKTICCSVVLPLVLFSFAAGALAQAVPEEARRYVVRGIAAIEMAKTRSDYILAAQEFEQAAKLAPDYPDVHFNLGKVYAKLEDFPSAIKSYQRYVELAPKSPDVAKVKEEIYKLEYRLDRQKLVSTLEGTWSGPNKQTFQLTMKGSIIELRRNAQQGDDMLTIKSMGTHVGPMTDVPLMFGSVLAGDKLSGQYLQPAGKYSGHCQVPERRGSFEGTVDAAAGKIRIIYTRIVFEYEMKFKSFLSAELVCTQTNRKEQPGYVLELTRMQ